MEEIYQSVLLNLSACYLKMNELESTIEICRKVLYFNKFFFLKIFFLDIRKK